MSGLERLGATLYPLFRKIYEESLASADQFVDDGAFQRRNQNLVARLNQIEQTYPNPLGGTNQEYYDSLTDAQKNIFFSDSRSAGILTALRLAYGLPEPVTRPATPPSASAQRQALLQATPPRGPQKGRKSKSLKRKSRKNRK
jgi:hypothetical protein